MRVSGLSINLKAYNIIHDTSNRYNTLLTQTSSGKKISKASEDPVLAQRCAQLDNLLLSNEQYSKNGRDVKAMLDFTESAIGQGTDLITRAKELAIQASSDTINGDSREAIVKEFDQVILELANIGNQQFNGKYIFAGSATTTKPFEVVGNPPTAVNYVGNDERISYNILENYKMDSNIPGSAVFEDVINDLIKVRDDIAAGDLQEITNVGFGLIEDGLDTLINARTELGAKSNIVEATMSRLTTLDAETKTTYTKLMGVDIAEKSIELAGVEISYQASLSVVGKLHSMSILNYI